MDLEILAQRILEQWHKCHSQLPELVIKGSQRVDKVPFLDSGEKFTALSDAMRKSNFLWRPADATVGKIHKQLQKYGKNFPYDLTTLRIAILFCRQESDWSEEERTIMYQADSE